MKLRKSVPKLVAGFTVLLIVAAFALPAQAFKEPPLPGEHLMGPATVAEITMSIEEGTNLICGSVLPLLDDKLIIAFRGNQAGQTICLDGSGDPGCGPAVVYLQEDNCDLPFRNLIQNATAEDLKNVRLGNPFDLYLGGTTIINTVVKFLKTGMSISADVVIMLVVTK